MRRSIDALPAQAPARRSQGYMMLYHQDAQNVCPGCGKRQWIIGRSTAECAFCETALPLRRNEDGGDARRFTAQQRMMRMTRS